MLWGRSAGRCAFPGCGTLLLVPGSGTGASTNLGEICHIVARTLDGPRGGEPLLPERRDDYSNLVLLCPGHHKLVDDQKEKYSVEILSAMKADHEKWVEQTLSVDEDKRGDIELYASYVDQWSDLADLARWSAWTSHLVSHGQPSLCADDLQRLDDLNEWLFTRVWPRRYPDLEATLENFRRVVNDLARVFAKHAERQGDRWWTRKFYHIDRWDEAEYDRLYARYSFHVCVIENLVLELTRAANLVCDVVRRWVFTGFRLDEGALLVTHGPYMDFRWHTWRPEYRMDERETGYPGLQEFVEVMSTRDCDFGSGSETQMSEFVREFSQDPWGLEADDGSSS